jgi:protein O-mannosyl-transferase
MYCEYRGNLCDRSGNYRRSACQKRDDQESLYRSSFPLLRLDFHVGYSSRVQLAEQGLDRPSALAGLLDRRGVAEVLVSAITFVAYLSTLSFGFVYDDKPVIQDNFVIRSWSLLARYLAHKIPANLAPPASGSFFRPITLLWLRVNYAIFGPNPAGWHFAMLMGHVLMSYLVFLVVGKLTNNRQTAAIAGILFGLHPVHVENVAWLSSVSDLLVSIFLLASFLAFLNYRDGKRLWMSASVLLFGLALLSKETAGVFPFLILGFAAMFAHPRTTENSQRVWAALKDGLASAPYFIILVTYLLARRMVPSGGGEPLAAIGWKTMLLTAPSVLWFDLKHLLLPISSSEFYSMDYVMIPHFANFWLPTLLVTAVLLAAGYCISKLRDPRLGIFSLGFAVLTILPALYLRGIAAGNFVHDRFLYLPSVGIVILIALALERPFVLETHAAVKWVVVTMISAAAFIGTLEHQVQWASNFTLYQNAMKYAPENPVVQVNLANEYASQGLYDRALPMYLTAVERDPRLWLSNYSLGYEYYRTGRFADAEDYLSRAIKINDRDPDQFIYLALAQMKQGKLMQATQNAENAIERAPQASGYHLVLGTILEAGGSRERAIAEYKAEVSFHPENKLAASELERLQTSQLGSARD